jgi:hypothetical protein
MDFILAATLGIAVGFVVGIVTRWVLCLTGDSFSEIAITLRILIGLQLGPLRDIIPSSEMGLLTVIGLLVSSTAILLRLIWVPRFLSSSLRARDPMLL